MKNIKLIFFVICLFLFLSILLCTFSFATTYIVKDQEGKNVCLTNQKSQLYEYINSGYMLFEVTPSGLSQISFESIIDKSQEEPKSEVIISETQVKTKPPATIVSTPVSMPKTNINREKVIETLRKNALAEWGNNTEMVSYEVKNQTEAYDWTVKQTKYPDIMEKAKQEWGDNYEMVKYEYENQVNAYEWLKNNKNKNPEAYKRASDQWGDNYEMIKYEYEKEI